MERVMKGLQWLATMALVVAGVLLLVKPLTAHAQTAAFVPTRFTVVDEGTVGKPDVVSTKPYAEMMRKQMMGMSAEQYAAMQPMMAAQLVKDLAAQKLVAASSEASDRAVVVEAISEDMQTDLRGEVAKMEMPTLVLYEHDPTLQQPDPAVYESEIKAGYKAMPHVTLVRMDESRHFIMYDQPAKFDAALEGFLQ